MHFACIRMQLHVENFNKTTGSLCKTSFRTMVNVEINEIVTSYFPLQSYSPAQIQFLYSYSYYSYHKDMEYTDIRDYLTFLFSNYISMIILLACCVRRRSGSCAVWRGNQCCYSPVNIINVRIIMRIPIHSFVINIDRMSFTSFTLLPCFARCYPTVSVWSALSSLGYRDETNTSTQLTTTVFTSGFS